MAAKHRATLEKIDALRGAGLIERVVVMLAPLTIRRGQQAAKRYGDHQAEPNPASASALPGKDHPIPRDRSGPVGLRETTAPIPEAHSAPWHASSALAAGLRNAATAAPPPVRPDRSVLNMPPRPWTAVLDQVIPPRSSTARPPCSRWRSQGPRVNCANASGPSSAFTISTKISNTLRRLGEVPTRLPTHRERASPDEKAESETTISSGVTRVTGSPRPRRTATSDSERERPRPRPVQHPRGGKYPAAAEQQRG